MLLAWTLIAALAQEPTTAELEVGPIAFTAVKDAPELDLSFDTCTSMAPVPPMAAKTAAPDGQLVFQVTFKRGKVSLVTVTRTEPSLDWLTPCLKRELASVEWDIRKGRAEVPVTVKLPEPPVVEPPTEPPAEPEPEPTPEPTAESPE